MLLNDAAPVSTPHSMRMRILNRFAAVAYRIRMFNVCWLLPLLLFQRGW